MTPLPRTPLAVLAVLLPLLALLPAAASPASARALPSKAVWKADVARVMAGSPDYLTERAAGAEPGTLAINLDIDNTSLASMYARGRAVKPVLAFAQRAHELGIAVYFNTGRLAVNATGVVAQLEKRGYTVDALCTRNRGETLPAGKQRCRASFVAAGRTIVANVGNNKTDFVGGDYERAYRLPNYRGQLG